MSDLVARVKYLEQENRRLRAALEKIVEVASEPPLEQPKAQDKTRREDSKFQRSWKYEDDLAKAFVRGFEDSK